MQDKLSVEYHMLRWRRWNQIETGKPQEPSCLIGKMIKTPPDEQDCMPLSDEEAAEVNTALEALKRRYPKAYDAVIVRYGNGIFDDGYAARLCRCSKTTLKDYRRQAHAFLDGAIFTKNCTIY